MANLTPTVADVRPIGAAVTTAYVQCGEALSQMDLVYRKTSDNRYYQASNDIDDEKATLAGLVLTPTDAADDYCIIIISGSIDPGTTLVLAEEYVASINEGKVAPKGDLAAGNRYSRIGYAKTTTELVVDIENTGATAP